MLQVEDHKLSLSDPITKFFPDAPETWRAITVRHLLTHTSGIPDYGDGTLDYRKDYTEDEPTPFAFGLRLEFPAGSRWNYSNTAYVLLGIIVHRVLGSFYGDVLAARKKAEPADFHTSVRPRSRLARGRAFPGPVASAAPSGVQQALVGAQHRLAADSGRCDHGLPRLKPRVRRNLRA